MMSSCLNVTCIRGNEQHEEEVPPEFICLFTRQVMHEPVLLCTPAGRTYEKAALIDWIARHPHRDPLTGHEHTSRLQFVTNHALEAAIRRWQTGYSSVTPKSDHLRMLVDSAFEVPVPTSPHKSRKKTARRHQVSRKHGHDDARSPRRAPTRIVSTSSSSPD